MRRYFYMNNELWTVKIVPKYDPILYDRSGVLTVGVTDPGSHTVYISNSLSDDMMIRVILHELGHCAMVSFDLLPKIHKYAKKEYAVALEEWICNFIADYCCYIFASSYELLGDDVIDYIVNQLEVTLYA